MTDYRTVPVEPTEEMIAAGERAAWDDDNSMPAIRAMTKAWSAMLAAAPALSASPAPAGDLVERDIAVIRDMVGDYAGNEQWDAWSRIQNEMARLRSVIAAMQPGWRDKPHCQSCGGEIQGWTCQGCGLTFRENDAGRLVADVFGAAQ
jgi:hypothetical protein